MNRFLQVAQELNKYSHGSTLGRFSRYSYGYQTVLEPIEITISQAERERILRSAGWKKSRVLVTIKNFLGEPLSNHRLFAEFQAPNVATQTHMVDVRGGSAIFSDIWLQPSGTLRLMAVRIGEPAPVPQGVIQYTLPRNNQLRLDAQQEHRDVIVTATSSSEAASKVGAKGTVGVDFEVFSAGGEVSSEESRTRGRTRSLQYTIRTPTGALQISAVP